MPTEEEVVRLPLPLTLTLGPTLTLTPNPNPHPNQVSVRCTHAGTLCALERHTLRL